MKRISKIITCSIALAILALGVSSTVKAEIDYASKENYYRNLCKTSTSYNNNKKACQGFEAYLKAKAKDLNAQIANTNKTIADTKTSIANLTKAIADNDLLIEAKKVEIEDNKVKVVRVKEDIAKKEAEMAEQLVTLQLTSNQNDVVDFIMSSTSLEEVIARVEGTSMIQEASNEIVKSMAKLQKDLEDTEKALVADEQRLVNLQETNKKLVADFRSKEAKLYEELAQQTKDKSFYNSSLDNININDVTGGNSSNGFIRPVSHATVTAISWYYPADFGGGWHPGVDLANNSGTPVIAPANGVILMRGYMPGGYGNFIVSAHEVGGTVYTFVYGHLRSSLSLSSVKQGQTIGYMGSTGASTGPHVHVEVFKHNTNNLQSVINKYKSTGDYWFGLGYNSTGNCSKVCRVLPHKFFGLSYYQKF